MKTFNEIRIDLVKIAEKMSLICKDHGYSDCENCPLMMHEFNLNGMPFESVCALMLLETDLDYYFDNINDIAEYFRPEEE
ncbi:MAG: hypothetical protein IIY58_00190 [Aeriscardovia sp.]|nr:hypothetical protein [Aeriscardovia sp.]